MSVLVTCGEPAGIGPEIAAAAWHELRGTTPFAWMGDPAHLPQSLPISLIEHPDEAASASGMPVIAHPFPAPARPGRPDPHNAADVIKVIERATRLVQDGAASALCTGPIHKAALIRGAGFSHPGHTEFLQAITGAEQAVMMLASDNLRVVPATIHIALSEVSHVLTPHRLRTTIDATAQGLHMLFGIKAPRIWLAGLNPHAGEDGTMGTQERDWITDLVHKARADGLDIHGPFPADSMFHAAARTRYDAAICMYHDQALIPIKTLDFDSGVNVTLGLPIIRTSPDHGTAFDIAHRGIARPVSMIHAIKMAAQMAQRTMGR